MKDDWIEFGLPFGRIYEDGKELPSAQKGGVIKPGMLIEFEDGEQMLVGHINALGGVCDDCGVGAEKVVKRYKVVWEGG